MTKSKNPGLTAKQFTDDLQQLVSKPPTDNARYFRGDDRQNKCLGVKMAVLFGLAKKYMEMQPAEIEKLLDSPYYEARMGAVSIMDFKARQKKISDESREELFNLYMKKHDRINNWDLVDRSAPFVVGGYLSDKPRKILYSLAKSKNVCERRTAIVSTWFFIRQNDVADTFKIAALLVHDQHDLINKAVGSWVREAGKRDRQKLIDFLDRFAATMPRETLRYAVEKLDSRTKAFYLGKK